MMSSNKKRVRQTQECIPNEFDVLRDLVKSQNEIKQYEYVETITKKWKEFAVFDKKKGFIFDVFHDLSANDLLIYLEISHVGGNRSVKRRFNMCQNLYVIQNYKEIICIWTRLALQYKNFKIYENIIDQYILFKNKIEKIVQLIEMGSLFRNQCVMHKFPMEI